uniref:Receptor ligand binding region domain-containing protein n=1 Tax=Romanomermis culicivorax TaxID=13658 RepID=A0A915IJ19_ROMCU
MADVVKNLTWTYVSALYDEGSYGEQGMEAFIKYANFRIRSTLKQEQLSKETFLVSQEVGANICIAVSIKIRRDFREADYIETVQKLKKQRGRGVIMYVNEDNIKRVLRAVNEQGLSGYFAWVASDNWGNKRTAVMENSAAAIGAITMQPKMKRSESKMLIKLVYLITTLHDSIHERRNFATNGSTNFGGRSLLEKHQQESYVPFVIDAVYLCAHALHAYFKNHCSLPPFTNCKQMKIDGTKLLRYIRNTSFNGTQDEVRLNENGDRMIRYIIYQYRGPMTPEQYVPIGEWVSSEMDDHIAGVKKAKELRLNETLVKSGYPAGKIPESQCGRPCSPIEYRSTIHSTCCWECLHCNETSIRPNETSCINCRLGFKPNNFKNECIPLVPETLQWTSPYAMVPACFSAMGITGSEKIIRDT